MKNDDFPELPTFDDLDELPENELQEIQRNLYILDDKIFDFEDE